LLAMLETSRGICMNPSQYGSTAEVYVPNDEGGDLCQRGNWLSVTPIAVLMVPNPAPANGAGATFVSWTIAIHSDTDNSLMGAWDKKLGNCARTAKNSASSKVNIIGINSDKPNDCMIIDKVSGSTWTQVEKRYPKMDMGIPSTLS